MSRLKLKDNVTNKELEKYGQVISAQDPIGRKWIVIVGKNNESINIEEEFRDIINNGCLGILYDMIKDDIVIKVSDEIIECTEYTIVDAKEGNDIDRENGE